MGGRALRLAYVVAVLTLPGCGASYVTAEDLRGPRPEDFTRGLCAGDPSKCQPAVTCTRAEARAASSGRHQNPPDGPVTR